MSLYTELMRRRLTHPLALSLALFGSALSGCAQGGGISDSGLFPPAPDANVQDAGPADAGEFPPDTSPPLDTGVVLPDTGVPVPDAGPPDAGAPDAGPMCTMDVDCDDSDACTVDACAGAMCSYTAVATTGSDCAAPIDVSAGGAFTGDATCASNDGGGACSAGDAPDVHFTFTLAEAADVTLDTLGSSFDAVISLGSTCVGGELGCDDDTAGGGQARLVRSDLAAGTYFVTLDGKAGGMGGAWTLNVDIAAGTTTEDVAFPAASGDIVFPSNGQFLFAGDYVQGTRTTSMPDITGASLTVNIPGNGLSCAVTLGMAINGTAVGTFTVGPGATTATGSFTFATLTGPGYTFRYERLSSSLCGIVQVGPGGTVTLSR